MKKFISLLTAFGLFVLVKPAAAFCPVCAVAVGVGLGLSRWLKIDDAVTGVWIGGFIVSLIGWTINWMNSKDWKFYGRKILITVLYYVLTFWPLSVSGIIGHPYNRLWGYDKLLVGTFFGSIVFLAMGIWYNYLKKKNNGHAYFPMQKVVMPVSGVLITSIIFYFITKP